MSNHETHEGHENDMRAVFVALVYFVVKLNNQLLHANPVDGDLEGALQFVAK